MKGYLVHPADQSGKLADRHRHPREPRPQPAYPGRGAARGARRLRGAGAGLSCRRLAARLPTRRRRASMFGQLDPAQTVANGVATVGIPEGARGRQRQGRRGRLLLGRRRGQQSRRRRARPRRRRRLLRRAAQRPRTIAKIKAALLLHYAGQDERINAGIDAYKAALERPARSSPSTSMRAPSTPSTTTPRRRATTRRPPTSPGAGRSPSSRRSWPKSRCKPASWARSSCDGKCGGR